MILHNLMRHCETDTGKDLDDLAEMSGLYRSTAETDESLRKRVHQALFVRLTRTERYSGETEIEFLANQASKNHQQQEKDMKTPHKHKDLIIAWANGATIERTHFSEGWIVSEPPSWDLFQEYRIKPEPKPDTELAYFVGLYDDGLTAPSVDWTGAFTKSNLKLTFDGETGNLKSAEVI